MVYEERIICFIDILGFKEIINKTINTDGSQNIEKINILEEAFSRIERCLDISEEKFCKSKMVTQFSDCIVISFKYTEKSEVFFTLLDIQHLLINLVYLGIICRGGIALGKLVHTEKMIFGPGLIDAYTLEAKAANYPRIILDQSIVRIAGEYHASHHTPSLEIEAVNSMLSRDSDGMCYIDYFASAQSELDDPDYDFPIYLQKLSEILEKGINSPKPDIRVKYSWLKHRYNEVVKKCRVAFEPKAGEDYDLGDAYNSLKIFPE